ncbi:MAG: hypothetical protein IT561_21270 [Alphaproteobacteria bacterium]|nr:hypothetical protein [Alphaproteobacteria bacterium]
MWGTTESTLDIRVAAVSGVLIAVVRTLMLLMERLTGLTGRMSSPGERWNSSPNR